MKAGILSLNINTEDLNHGAMLHSWAFQQYLRTRLGVASEVIDYITPRAYGMNLEHPVWCHLKNGKIKPALVAALGARAYRRRYKKFRNFIDKHYTVSKQKYSQELLAEAKLDYDVLFCESDVIWDPVFFQGKLDPAFFLGLPSMRSARRIAYSPSMGNLTITAEEAEEFKALLHNLDSISCRETYAADYVRTQCGREAVAVVDPVLLLNRKDYAPITGRRRIEEPYVFLYTPVGYDLKLISLAKAYAKLHRIKLVEVSRYSWNNFSHTTVADAGIEEFLSLILYSDCVLTNSFHGVCMSLLFHKDFYAFPRATGRKIEDICRRVGLEERYMREGFRELPPVDYDETERNLRSLRKMSEDYIYNAIYGKSRGSSAPAERSDGGD